MICDFIIPILIALVVCAIKSGWKRQFHGKQMYEPFCTSSLPLPFLCPIENKETSATSKYTTHRKTHNYPE
nr:unnamed protein product [Callosobruchus analis]